MNPKLMRSVVSLVAILGLGTGVSFALLQSDNVTIAASNVTTGSANLKICDITPSVDPPTWGDSVGAIDLDGLIPGQQLVMTENDVYLGNDAGQLNTSVCQYGTPGSSDVIMDIVPSLTAAATCNPGITPADMQLNFDFGGVESGFGTLEFWADNATSATPFTVNKDLAINGNTPIKITALLSNAATTQDATCNFGIQFKGTQS